MTASHIIFQNLISLSLIAWIVAVVATTRFIARHKQSGQSQLNPVHGISLWTRFLTRGGFGEDAEPGRRRVVHIYIAALVLFAAAILVFVVGGVGDQ